MWAAPSSAFPVLGALESGASVRGASAWVTARHRNLGLWGGCRLQPWIQVALVQVDHVGTEGGVRCAEC